MSRNARVWSGPVRGPVRGGGGFGDATFDSWIARTQALGGHATTWPFSTGLYGKFFGRPAMKFDTATYVRVANAGQLPDRTAPQQTTTDSQWAYVLASDAVAAGAPHVLTTAERIENSVLVAGDKAAETLHLPSLSDIEAALKTVGRDALLVVAVGGLAWYLLHRRGTAQRRGGE